MEAELAVDFTAVITTHSEGRLLRPTLRTVAAALQSVTDAGFSSELLLVRDRCDVATATEVDRWAARVDLSFEVRILDVDLGESGAARNAGARAARGAYVAFVDGDDLVSDDYFLRAAQALELETRPTVMHPHLVLSFGARALVWETEATRGGAISYADLLRHNQWPSSSVARREVYLETPYRSLPPGGGYGPEDWVWNIDTIVKGVEHDVVPDTVFFYRVRHSGGVNNRHQESILPWIDIDELCRRLPISKAATGAGDAREKPPVAHRVYAAALPVVRWSTAWLSYEVKHTVYRSARRVYRAVTRSAPAEPPRLAPRVARSLLLASAVEPAVSWAAHAFTRLDRWHAGDDGYGEILARVSQQLGSGGALVTVPWLGVGGADMVSANYARALAQSSMFAGRVRILGTYLEDRNVADEVPAGTDFLHLPARWLALPPHLKRRLIAQLFVQIRPAVVVSVGSFHVTEALGDFHRQMLDGTRMWVTLFAWDKLDEGYPVNPITDDAQRDYLDHIEAVITDNSCTAGSISDVLAITENQIAIHRQPAMIDIPPLRTDQRAYRESAFTSSAPFRVIWPHRIDPEKRPDVVVRIALECRRRGLPIVIDVWGGYVISESRNIEAEFTQAGVTYRGTYRGGLPALPMDEYHAMLLTSQSEGLPLAVVQSMLLGVPVVASAVGGVTDIVHDLGTGLLADGPEDIAGFVDALERLMTDVELRRSIIRDAYSFAAAEHSWEHFIEEIALDLLNAARS